MDKFHGVCVIICSDISLICVFRLLNGAAVAIATDL